MIGPVFVDRNVVVYWHSALEPQKQARADSWYKLLWKLRVGRLSVQVLLETYSKLTKWLIPAVPDPGPRAIIRESAAWNPVPGHGDRLLRAHALRKLGAVAGTDEQWNSLCPHVLRECHPWFDLAHCRIATSLLSHPV